VALSEPDYNIGLHEFRLEADILITADGCENLNSSPRWWWSEE
jgi:Xaa-Pro aminopeptidase